MTQAVAIGLSPFFGGQLRRNKGVMNAVSGPASFAAVQGTWTLGYLNPNSWFRSDYAFSVTLGATRATVNDIDLWNLLNTVRASIGGWWEIRSWPFANPLNRYIYTGPFTDWLANAPCGYVVEVKRGAPPPGYGSNQVRFWSNLLTVDIDLDTGAVIGGSYETCEVQPLGLTPDDGYRVTLRGAYDVVGNGVAIGLLNSGSTTYTDAPGDGHFFVKNPDLDQYRVERWSSMTDWSMYFEQLDPALQFVYWTDSHGRCLASSLVSYMTGTANVASLVSGVEQPFTLAVAANRVTAYADARLLYFDHAISGHWIQLAHQETVPQARFTRTGNTGAVTLDTATTSPFVGTTIARYDGSYLRLCVNGVDAPPAAVAAGSVCTIDRLSLGYSVVGSNWRLGYLREVSINSRSWSDLEKSAANISLLNKWNYP